MKTKTEDAKIKLQALRKKMGVLPMIKKTRRSRRIRKRLNAGLVGPSAEAPKTQKGVTKNFRPRPGGSKAVVGPKVHPPTRKSKREKKPTKKRVTFSSYAPKNCNKVTQTDEAQHVELEAVEGMNYPVFFV